MNFIKYIIYIFKNRKQIQETNWNLWAYERTADIHISKIQDILGTKVDIHKFNYLTHEDCFNDETITISKRNVVMLLDSLQSLATMQDKVWWPKNLISEYRKYIYK